VVGVGNKRNGGMKGGRRGGESSGRDAGRWGGRGLDGVGPGLVTNR